MIELVDEIERLLRQALEIMAAADFLNCNAREKQIGRFSLGFFWIAHGYEAPIWFLNNIDLRQERVEFRAGSGAKMK